ncbi:uridine kinase [Psychromonas sp. psych-6C06]|uniref:uridine kinase n=1 Tax=Psychromonas sp. psych-6C06 TaxID=2058089 RepID=UPI000C34FA77|nr:uridine kinase [Psychromonas sp. psych-6C06]PKF60758.1 uridine kinase [Psychromonas sp. psych-6C06]
MKTVFNTAAQIKSELRDLHARKGSNKAQIVAISGIEGGGKRALTQKIANALQLDGISVAIVHSDDWEAAANVRFNVMNSPEQYYLNAYRLDEMVEELILPLKLFGSIKASVTLDDVMNPRTVDYDFEKIDIILIEGVYLLQSAYLELYDYSIWVKSDFDAAFARLDSQVDIEQSQEALVNLFEGLIKPAAQYHIFTDDPQGCAQAIYIEEEKADNDNQAKT